MLREELRTAFDNLKQIRDELRVQVHLAQVEARDEFAELEHKWNRVEGHMKQVGEASTEALKGVGEAAELLLEELGEGYKRIKKAL